MFKVKFQQHHDVLLYSRFNALMVEFSLLPRAGRISVTELSLSNLTIADVEVEILKEGTKLDVQVKQTSSSKKLTVSFSYLQVINNPNYPTTVFWDSKLTNASQRISSPASYSIKLLLGSHVVSPVPQRVRYFISMS